MNMLNDTYGILIAYNIWANRQTLEQVKTLSQDEFVQELGGSFPSLKLTLNHLLESDWIWLNRWQGSPFVAVPTDWNISTADSIEAIWQDIQKQIERYFELSLPDSLEQVIKVETKRGDQFSLPLWQTINHTVNHGTYHRGQLTNMIRMLGYKPIATDMFIFFNQTNNQSVL